VVPDKIFPDELFISNSGLEFIYETISDVTKFTDQTLQTFILKFKQKYIYLLSILLFLSIFNASKDDVKGKIEEMNKNLDKVKLSDNNKFGIKQSLGVFKNYLSKIEKRYNALTCGLSIKDFETRLNNINNLSEELKDFIKKTYELKFNNKSFNETLKEIGKMKFSDFEKTNFDLMNINNYDEIVKKMELKNEEKEK